MLAAGAIVALLTAAFPPWTEASPFLNTTEPRGCSFFLFQPDSRFSDGTVSLDWDRLCLQWFMVAMATAAGVLLLPEKHVDGQPG